MPYYIFAWDDETIAHLAEHDVSQDDFERVVCDPDAVEASRTTGRSVAFGTAEDGRYLICCL